MKNKIITTIAIKILILSCFISYGQSIGPKKKQVEGKIRQKDRLKMLNPSYDIMPSDEILKKHEELTKFKRLTYDERNTTTWELVGPNGHISAEGFDFYCSGRVRDIEVLSDNHIRVASASGGLFDINKQPNGSYTHKNLTNEQVLTPWAGSVASDPYDQNIILYGSGEPYIRWGTGLWRSIDGGANWTRVPIADGIGLLAFDEINFTKVKGKVWACGTGGVIFSEDSGASWKLVRQGDFSGLITYDDNPDKVLVAERGKGIYQTTNQGRTWAKLSNGLPNSGFVRIRLSNCRTFPDIIYALYTTDKGDTHGIYKSINGGSSWSRCTVWNADGIPNVDYHWGMADYCSFISVSPVNPNHVISGGGWYIYSEDGSNFYGPTNGQHADFHTGDWSPDGSIAYFGNDGGIYSTNFDKKWNWNYKMNFLPITQFVTISVGRKNPNAISGGTQDNGIVSFNTISNQWSYLLGDGGGVTYDSNNEHRIYATLGVSGYPLSFRNYYKRGPSIFGWAESSIGIEPSDQWWRLVRSDRNNPATIYTQANEKVYYSLDEGQSWNLFYTDKINISYILSMRVSHGLFPNIYVSGYGTDGHNCLRLNTAEWEWFNIFEGLPLIQNPDEFTIPHLYVSENSKLPNRVYALMRGYGDNIKGKVLFKSDEQGLNWVNISGNLPDLPYTVMMEHPRDENVLVVGTDGFGAFISLDGGKNWNLWDDGMPNGTFITDFEYQEYGDGSIFIVMSTYGHSIWRRPLPNSKIVNTYDESIFSFDNQIINAYFDNDLLVVILKSTPSSPYKLKICNLLGQPIFHGECLQDSNVYQSTIDNLSTGTYIVSISNNGRIIGTQKILKKE